MDATSRRAVFAYDAPLISIGRGSTRECYAHPLEPTRCVKVPFTRRGEQQSERELRYLARVRRRYPDEDLRHVALGLGRTPTSHGTGHVFQRVVDVDADGRIGPSPTLLEALRDGLSVDELPTWTSTLARFRSWALSTSVVLRDLHADNVCLQRLPGGEPRLVVIDGIGPRGFLPRYWPTRAYARERNRAMLLRYGFDDPARLVNHRHARARMLAATRSDRC